MTAPRRFATLCFLLALPVAGGLFSASAGAADILGVSALVGRDATDPENDASETCVINGQTPLQCGFAATFSGNDEAFFGGEEGAFNVFDNEVGGGGNKWCCDAPAVGTDDPLTTGEDESGSIYVQAEFAAPFVLHAFTLATGNDIQPGRDPDIFKLQGSNDGVSYTDIYSYDADGASPFGAANQVLLLRAGYDYPTPAAYRIFRYRAFSTVGGTQHHLNEIELFELGTVPQTIATGGACTLHDAILAANRGLAVGSCAKGSHGPDTIVLGADVTLAAADTADAAHAAHTTERAGAAAGLPDVREDLAIVAGAGTRIERAATLGCVDEDATSFRLLTARAALTLEGLTLQNGCVAPGGTQVAQGGALFVESGGATLLDTTFRDNQVRGSPGTSGFGFPADGGAVTIASGTSLIDGSVFEGNAVRGGTALDSGGPGIGGALAAFGSLQALTDTRFEGNSVAAGSATNNNSGVGAPAIGGAALVSGMPGTLARLVFRDNEARGGSGHDAGGPATAGALALLGQPSGLTDVLFETNLAQGGASASAGGPANGGALYGNLTSGERITAVGNEARGGSGQGGGSATGGGLALNPTATPSLSNLTLVGNAAVGASGFSGGAAVGGGLFAGSTRQTELLHVTAIDNRVQSGSGMSTGTARGGGIAALFPLHLGHALLKDNANVAGNAPAVLMDCELTGSDVLIVSLGHNRVQATGPGCILAEPTDQTSVSVPTATLDDHGCVTPLPGGICLPTVALAGGSALAINAGSCAVSAEDDDARELPRPQDIAGYGDGVDDCDIGAFEASDGDGDSALDTEDNCPVAANASQADADADGLGDACDACRSSHAPQFTVSGPFQAAVGAPAGTVLGSIDAHNGGAADEGIAYAVTGRSGEALFDVAPGDGTIRLRAQAPAAPGAFTLQVSATDCAAGTSATVTLQLLAVPIFADSFED